MRVHDLLWTAQDAEMFSMQEPPWVRESIKRCPVVVVRRAEAPAGFVAIGIRGVSRTERHAALLRLRDVHALRSPESLAAAQEWRGAAGNLSAKVTRALQLVSDCSKENSLAWGPIGSVGYQLATGMAVTNSTSDLDVLIRCGPQLDDARLRKFATTIQGSAARVDIVLESDGGSVSLDEYLHSRQVLIKTRQGPRIGVFAW